MPEEGVEALIRFMTDFEKKTLEKGPGITMYHIKLFNKISESGLSHLDPADFVY